MNILGGYQKTGTEWLKFILVNLTCGKQETWADYNTALCNLADFCDEPLSGFYKSHFPDAIGMTKGIAQVRHPFDVCMSAYRYVHRVDKFDMVSIPVFIDLFIANRGEVSFNRMNCCDYVEHVQTWTEQVGTALVKHEDLRGPNGAAHLHRALNNIGLNYTFGDVWRAMDLASVDRMRSLDVTGHLGTMTSTWREAWTEEQRFRGGIAFRPIMDRFGYEQ